jgi:uncharacterized membrane protein YfbV (UPF0208 family)
MSEINVPSRSPGEPEEPAEGVIPGRRISAKKFLIFATLFMLALAVTVEAQAVSGKSIFTVVAVILAAVGAATLPFFGIADSAAKPEKPDYRQRIADVREHLLQTGRLLRELEDDLATRTEILTQRQADADRYEKLASMNAEQAKAIEDLIGRQFSKQSRSTKLQWWFGLLLAFVLGLIVNWVSQPLLNWILH